MSNKEKGIDNVTLTNSPEKEKELENIICASLEKQRVQGIRIGMLAASKAVMEHLNDTSKPLLKRIEAIKKFCSVALKDEDKFLNQGINDIPAESEVKENE